MKEILKGHRIEIQGEEVPGDPGVYQHNIYVDEDLQANIIVGDNWVKQRRRAVLKYGAVDGVDERGVEYPLRGDGIEVYKEDHDEYELHVDTRLHEDFVDIRFREGVAKESKWGDDLVDKKPSGYKVFSYQVTDDGYEDADLDTECRKPT